MRKKKLKRGLKDESKKEERSLKITSFFLKKKRIEDNQKKEKEMMKRLDELNPEFREIKNFSKNSKKMFKSILEM